MTLDDLMATAQESLLSNGVPKETVAKVLRDIQRAAEEEKADRKAATGKKAKTQFVILAVKPESGLAEDTIGWAIQVEDSYSPAVVKDRIQVAANAFNGSKRGRKAPVKTVGECLENVPAKWYKTTNPTEITRVKTRTPVLVEMLATNTLAL